MCGRIAVWTGPDDLARLLVVDDRREQPQQPSWNVAPGRPLTAAATHDGSRVLTTLRWGLVPSWADDPSVGSRMINARAETIAERPAFRGAVRRRRCAVPADAFYEWAEQPGGPKQPHLIARADRQPMVLAGVWESWRGADDERLLTAAIVTCPAGPPVRALHHRMPVVLADPPALDAWLEPATPLDDALRLLGPCDERLLTSHPVAREVNRADVDHPGLIEPLRT